MIESLFSLDGKVCAITGGSRGLGYYMAQGFLEAGAARVYITARKAAACIEAAEALSNLAPVLPCPVTLVHWKRSPVWQLCRLQGQERLSPDKSSPLMVVPL